MITIPTLSFLSILTMNVNAFRLQMSDLQFSDDLLCVRIQVPEATITAAAAVSLTVVIDISGSMSMEDKLINVIRTINSLLDYMTDQDELSIVTFASESLIPFRHVPTTSINKDIIRTELAKLRPNGSTNIEKALRSVQEILQTPSTGLHQKKGVLLLTDGDATDGQTAPDKLLTILQQVLTAHSDVTFSTIGYGSDHKAELLASMSKEGQGSYNIVNRVEQVADIFGLVLGGLRSAVYQQVKLLVPPTVRQVSRFTEHKPVPVIGSSVTPTNEIILGDLCAGNDFTVLLEDVQPEDKFHLYSVEVATGLLDMTLNLNIHEGSPEDLLEARVSHLRSLVSAFLQKISDPTIPFRSVEARNPLWCEGMRLEARHQILSDLVPSEPVTRNSQIMKLLERELSHSLQMLQRPVLIIPPPPELTRMHSNMMSQHAGYLSSGRGNLSVDPTDAYEDATDPVANVFANSTQRSCSEGLRSATRNPDTPRPAVNILQLSPESPPPSNSNISPTPVSNADESTTAETSATAVTNMTFLVPMTPSKPPTLKRTLSVKPPNT
jgi:hypothetical protein